MRHKPVEGEQDILRKCRKTCGKVMLMLGPYAAFQFIAGHGLVPVVQGVKQGLGLPRRYAPCGARIPTNHWTAFISRAYDKGMRRIPPLAAIRVFEAAARHENFTKAADELGMTQAAVSYQVKLLEERLGAALFHRVGRQVQLSEIGRRIAPMVSGAFDTLDDAFGIARTDSEAVLTISCSNTFASNWLALRLGGFQMQRPGLAVRLHTADHIVDFAREEVDVAIRNSPDPWPGLVSHFLMRVPILPLASPAFLAKHPPVATPADVMALPRLSPDDVWWDQWLDAVGGGARRQRTATGLRLDSQILEGNAAIAGQGVAVINPAMWLPELRSGRLVAPIDAVAYGRRHYWLVYPEYRRHAPKVQAFRDWLLGEMEKDAATDEYGCFTGPVETAASPRS